MSKHDDVLFCNIAIAQGLVSKEAAAKALGLCDKREQESGRRPLIGAVFTKYNIMQNQDVQRVYAAVQKRLGRSTGPQLAVAKGKKGKKALSSFDKRSKPTRPIDPKTLWLGIGGIVVFATIVVIMFVLVILPSGKTKTNGGGGDASGTASSVAKAGGAGGGPAAKTGGAAAAGTTKREIPADVQLQVDSKIGDAVSGMGVGPEEGLSGLKLVEKQLREKGYEPPQKLLDAIQQLEQRVKEEGGAAETPASTPASAPAAAPAGSAAPAGDAPKTAEKAETPAAKPAEKAKEPAPAADDVDSLIDNL